MATASSLLLVLARAKISCWSSSSRIVKRSSVGSFSRVVISDASTSWECIRAGMRCEVCRWRGMDATGREGQFKDTGVNQYILSPGLLGRAGIDNSWTFVTYLFLAHIPVSSHSHRTSFCRIQVCTQLHIPVVDTDCRSGIYWMYDDSFWC